MDIPMSGAPAHADRTTLDQELRSHLDSLVKQHDLVLFMKGTPDAPQCGFSARAAEVLKASGHPFHAVNVFATEDPAGFIHALAEWAQFPTLPQVWVKGELIGGSDIVLEMHESGELEALLA